MAPAAMASFLYFWFVILFDAIHVEPAVGVWVLAVGRPWCCSEGSRALQTRNDAPPAP